MSASHPPKTNPTPNFFSTYSVVVPVSLQTAYMMLGTAAGHGHVCRLSKLCTSFELLEMDEVSLPVPNYPEGKKLSDVGVRTAIATSSDPDAKTGSAKTLKRQHFAMELTIPIIFGFFKKKVKVVGTLTWDDSVLSPSSPAEPSFEGDSPAEALHESLSDSGGIVIWKLRTFDKVYGEPKKTRITERIEGWAPSWLRSMAQDHLVTEHQ